MDKNDNKNYIIANKHTVTVLKNKKILLTALQKAVNFKIHKNMSP